MFKRRRLKDTLERRCLLLSEDWNVGYEIKREKDGSYIVTFYGKAFTCVVFDKGRSNLLTTSQEYARLEYNTNWHLRNAAMQAMQDGLHVGNVRECLYTGKHMELVSLDHMTGEETWLPLKP